MSARKRRTPTSSSVPERAREVGAAIAAVIAVTAGLVSIASFMGYGPGSSTSSTHDPSGLRVAITSAAIRTTEGGQAIYEIQGSETGVTDPPWRVYLLAQATARRDMALLCQLDVTGWVALYAAEREAAARHCLACRGLRRPV